jgi:hypothetical protein
MALPEATESTPDLPASKSLAVSDQGAAHASDVIKLADGDLTDTLVRSGLVLSLEPESGSEYRRRSDSDSSS